ncbi:MAG: monovalent cation/H(+) antiporter subunit G [Corynebacterium sp.]|uniref:monovalent cation/H(+) antiporter subunit G n=1 Tax=Corynebacterium sp. TaxID=1720 RepID=UPI0026DF2D7F|nr:monovalent cation/H(+) antiporter subunit G [Corynebacterium sp.]MDO5669253.1 monovalent cation/H(+) antiporter subunit G [Corynebacterium sp.]
MITDILGGVIISVGVVFFTAGTIGLIRFPDVRSQLHALTKADNLGLGLVLLGVGILSQSLVVVAALLLVWAVALGSASISAQSLAELDAMEEQGSKGGATV